MFSYNFGSWFVSYKNLAINQSVEAYPLAKAWEEGKFPTGPDPDQIHYEQIQERDNFNQWFNLDSVAKIESIIGEMLSLKLEL